jgi:hypothetical protein
MLSVAQQPALNALQQRADEAHGVDCARLSMQVARRSLEDAHHFFSNNSQTAHNSIDVALRYATRAVDCALESHKHQKTIEIELRGLIRRTREVARTVDTEDRSHVTHIADDMEKQRDRLLQSIFGFAGITSQDSAAH